MQKNNRFSKKREGTVFLTVGVQIWRQNLILARSTPPLWSVKFPSSSIYVNARVRSLWMAVKITFSLALSELVLDNAKVEILLISGRFLVVLLKRPLPSHLLTPACFGILKVFRWYISGAKFHLCLICCFRVFKFKMFSYQQKVQF